MARNINLTKDKLLKAYTRLGSCNAVGRKFGCDGSTVQRYMLYYGLEVKPQIRYSCDESFFEKDSEEVYYWAGFLAADGCAKTRKSTSGKTRYQISLGLASKDAKHIELFQQAIKSNHKIHHLIVKNSRINKKWNDSKKSEITIESKQMFNSLERFNIIPRKSLVYTFPNWIINHNFVHHFMRGYFDGDGSWYWHKYDTKKNQLIFNLRGTVKFLTVFRSILQKECGLPINNKPIRTSNNIGVLEYGGNNVCKKISEYLYQDSSICLDRKENIINI